MFLRVILVLLFLYICSASRTNNKRFPSDFLFGIATADYQIEGAWNKDGRGTSLWDFLTHNTDFITDRSTGDIAADSYHKYKEDIALLKAMGVNHYRFSMAWTRILPTGNKTKVNPLGIAYYKKVLDELKRNGIIPMVTIYHYDMPIQFFERGGHLNPSFPDWIADFAEVLFDEFGNEVKYWFTINEPYVQCMYGPADEAYVCAKILLKAHAKVWHLYNDRYRSKYTGKISIVLNSPWYEPETNTSDDIIAAKTMMQFTYGIFGHPLYQGDWPLVVKSRVYYRSKLENFTESRLPKFTQEEIEHIKGTNDILAFNIYSACLTRAIPEAEIEEPTVRKDIGVYNYQPDRWIPSDFPTLKVVPWGLRNLLRWFKAEYSNPEILITENGYADNSGEFKDDRRIYYIQSHLSAIKDSMDYDGVNIIGYTYWTLMDNFEWLSGYTSKFGLVHVDFNDPNRTRTRKESSYYYQHVCQTHCLLKECIE